jgi:DNA invertase Pin-like site-specific DNA recombinase
MRVSTNEQNLVLQRDALEAAGCERLYDDIPVFRSFRALQNGGYPAALSQ